jgi:hypothetical protein
MSATVELEIALFGAVGSPPIIEFVPSKETSSEKFLGEEQPMNKLIEVIKRINFFI